MKEILSVIFDLDGTLMKSDKTIFQSMLKALKDIKIELNLSQNEFQQYIGLHFVDIFQALNIQVQNLDLFFEKYKTYYYKLINLTEIYPDVENVLRTLYEKGIKISLLTTKSQEQADKIIDYFGLRKYFSIVMGRRKGVQHKPSAEPINLICSELGIAKEKTIMVGDTEMDIGAGKNAGVFTAAVSYGFRNKDELFNLNPDFIFENISEILKIID